MNTLTSIFTREIPPDIRIPVLRALTQRPLVQGQWATNRKGCLMAVAAGKIQGISMREFKRIRDPSLFSAQVLGISENRVEAGYQEWDALSKRQAARFIRRMKVELGILEGKPRPNVVVRTAAKVRDLVTA